MVDSLRESLYGLALQFKPSYGVVINMGVSEIHNDVYNYRIISRKRDNVRVALAWYFNSPKRKEQGHYRNCFVFSGELYQYSIYQGRTYITLKQLVDVKNRKDYTLLKVVLNGELDLKESLGEQCILCGYLFPRPLGSRDIAISGCGEILKIKDKITYNDGSVNLS